MILQRHFRAVIATASTAKKSIPRPSSQNRTIQIKSSAGARHTVTTCREQKSEITAGRGILNQGVHSYHPSPSEVECHPPRRAYGRYSSGYNDDEDDEDNVINEEQDNDISCDEWEKNDNKEEMPLVDPRVDRDWDIPDVMYQLSPKSSTLCPSRKQCILSIPSSGGAPSNDNDTTDIDTPPLALQLRITAPCQSEITAGRGILTRGVNSSPISEAECQIGRAYGRNSGYNDDEDDDHDEDEVEDSDDDDEEGHDGDSLATLLDHEEWEDDDKIEMMAGSFGGRDWDLPDVMSQFEELNCNVALNVNFFSEEYMKVLASNWPKDELESQAQETIDIMLDFLGDDVDDDDDGEF